MLTGFLLAVFTGLTWCAIGMVLSRCARDHFDAVAYSLIQGAGSAVFTFLCYVNTAEFELRTAWPLILLIVGAGVDCTDYDEELQQVNITKTRLMEQKAELEHTQQTAPDFERRMEELNAAVDGTGAALTDFDELTVRQLVSNIKVLDRDSLLIRFKDGTELVRQKG